MLAIPAFIFNMLIPISIKKTTNPMFFALNDLFAFPLLLSPRMRGEAG